MFFQRLDNVLVQHGICSKRSVKNFIQNNNVCINQTRIFDGKIYVDEQNDSIFVNNRKIESNHLYIMLNKPAGYVCSTVSDRSAVVYQLLDEYKNHPLFNKIHSVGRLDKETEGLLLFTTNGNFSNYITKKENDITKKYYVELEIKVTKEEQKKITEEFYKGIFIPQENKSSSFVSKPAILEWLSDNSCYITITEGKFHQVRRMFSAIKNTVTYLKRIAIGNLYLNDLSLSETKILTKEELDLI